MHHLAVRLLAVACLASAAAAQPIYFLQQERHVAVSWSPSDPNAGLIQQATAPGDFGEWLADVSHASDEGKPLVGTEQYSDFQPATIDAFGSASICWDQEVITYSNYYNTATNYCRLKFAVPQPTTYDVIGYASVEITVDYASQPWSMVLVASVELRQIAGPTLYADEAHIWASGDPYEIVEFPVFLAGEMNPGVYELIVSAELQGASDTAHPLPIIDAEASYVISAEFAAATPEDPGDADLDGDGDVDLADFGRFQRAFSGPLLGMP